jgi:PAS domain S-box-containing protein
MLNGFTGFEALAIAKEYASDLPFIIISGTVGEEVAVEAMRRGAHDYIMKNNLVRLGEALKRELRDAETRRQHQITKINLQDRENQIESILSASPLGIGSLIDRKFTFINGKVCEMLGYSSDELIGQDTRILYESNEEYTRIGNYIYSEGITSQGNVITRLLTKTGTPLHINLNFAFIDPSKPTAITFTLEDITEKILAEIALEESRRKYKYMYTLLHSIGDNMPDMIWAKNTKKEYLFANQALCSHLLNAVDTDEPIGKTDVFFALRERNSHPDDPDWHTFGEICMDSDDIVMESKKAQRFDEFGNVK